MTEKVPSCVPLNVPPLEALESIVGFVPEDVRERVLLADLHDDLSGLREIARRQRDPDGWANIAQPKLEIGSYAETHGIRVPKRYETLDEALYAAKRGQQIILRSEHPQEYDRFSGLLESVVVDEEGAEGIAGLIDRGLPEHIAFMSYQNGFGSGPIERFLHLSGQNPGDFYEQLTYSFWEYIPGTNIMVVADDAIADRYHITAINFEKGEASGWVGNQEGVAESGSLSGQLSDSLLDQQAKVALIKQYEKVRNLPKFSARQCPIMEFQQADDGTIWFLQYHKARPFRPSHERLLDNDYPEAEGWFKADGVRGALGALVTLKTALWYPSRAGSRTPTYMLSGPEEASFDLHYDRGLTEFASPNRVAHVTSRSCRAVYAGMADGGHEVRSRWFKPSSALSLGKTSYQAMIPKGIKENLEKIVMEEDSMGRIVLDFASDGLRGYVRLNPDTKEQPIVTQY